MCDNFGAKIGAKPERRPGWIFRWILTDGLCVQKRWKFNWLCRWYPAKWWVSDFLWRKNDVKKSPFYKEWRADFFLSRQPTQTNFLYYWCFLAWILDLQKERWRHRHVFDTREHRLLFNVDWEGKLLLLSSIELLLRINQSINWMKQSVIHSFNISVKSERKLK